MAEKDIFKIVTCIAIGFVLGLIFGCILISTVYENGAIKANCGHYNYRSGNFQWGPSLIAEKKDDGNL